MIAPDPVPADCRGPAVSDEVPVLRWLLAEKWLLYSQKSAKSGGRGLKASQAGTPKYRNRAHRELEAGKSPRPASIPRFATASRRRAKSPRTPAAAPTGRWIGWASP